MRQALELDAWRRVKSLFLELRNADADACASCLADEESRISRAVCALLAADSGPDRWDEAVPGGHVARHGILRTPGALGEYSICRTLGSGAFGVVYLAEQVAPRREVALKVFRLPFGPAQASRWLVREANVLGRMRHPGIAQVYEVGIARSEHGEEIPYLSMEFVSGLDVVQHAQKAELLQMERVGLMADIADAIGYAHRQGVIHRDLKPANILIDANGHPKIVDFGLARLLAPAGGDRSTIGAHALGTVAYMSPEQARGGDREVDTRSDVYSLGVVLFELLTGRTPIDVSGKSLPEALRLVADAESIAADAAKCIEGDLRHIVQMALAPEIERRYQSAPDLAADLRRFISCEPVMAHPASAGYMLRKVIRRHWASVSGVAVILLSLLLSLAVLLASNRRASGMLDASRIALGTLLTEAVERQSLIVGTRAERRALLGRLEAEIAPLMERRTDDPRIAREYARLLTALSDFDLDEDRPKQALRRRTEALELYRGLAAMRTHDLAAQAAVSIAAVKVGDVHKHLGDSEAALRLYTEAMTIDQNVVGTVPESLEFIDNLAWSFNRIGALRLEAGDPSSAELLIRRQIDVSTELTRREPGRALSWFSLLAGKSVLADVLDAQGRILEADEQIEERIEIARELVRSSPDHCMYEIGLAAALSTLARRHLDVGDLDLAHASAQEAVVRLERLVALEPGSYGVLDNLKQGLFVLTDIAVASGSHREAVGLSDRSVTVAQHMLALRPDSAVARWGVEEATSRRHSFGSEDRQPNSPPSQPIP